MKKLFLFSVMTVLLFSFKEPETLKWYSWKEGSDLALSQNKPVFLFVCVSWCDMSQRMEKKIFTNKEVLPLITGNFIPVKIDIEVDSNLIRHDKSFNRKMILTEVEPGKFALSVPKTIFTDGKGNDPVVMAGLQDPSELKDNINKYLKK